MRVLFISSSYLPKIGGLENLVSQVASDFLRQGHKVKVITQKYPRNLSKSEVIKGVEVNRILFFHPQLPLLKLRSIIAYLYTFLLAPINLLKFVTYLRRFCPDVVNYHFVGAPTFFLLVYLKFFKTKLVVSLHGEDVMVLPFESKVSMYLFKSLLKKAEVVVANSYYTLNKALIIAPFAKDKSVVIYPGINFEEFKDVKPYSHIRRYIFSLGRFVYKKGFDVLIKAFNLVVEEVEDIDLIIAGDGPQRAYLEQLINKFNLRDRVSLWGWASREEALALLKGCEFFVLPSRNEPLGIVMLEALASRKPVIATKSGGPQEVIQDGINGVLVDKGNPEALAKAILNLCKERDLSESISNNFLKYINNFDIDHTLEKYSSILGIKKERC